MPKLYLLMVTLILTACTYSKYSAEEENFSIPEKWEITSNSYSDTDADLVCLPWWKQFHDPTLNKLVDEGLIYNNDINIAMSNVEAAHGELKRVELNWIPEVSIATGYSSFPYLGYPGILFNAIPTYTINIFDQIKEQKRAHYQLKATKAMYEGVRLAVIGQITGSYFSYVAQVEQLELLSSLEQDLAKVMNISQSMLNGGLFSGVEVNEAKTALHLIQAQEKVVQHNIIVSQNALKYLLNKNPGNLEGAQRFSQLQAQHMAIGTLPFNVIENRPDMQQAAQELKASNAGIDIAVSGLLPTVQLSMARGYIATEPNGWTLGQPIYFNQALLEIPIIEASVLGEIATARGLNKASYYRYEDTLRKVLRDVTNDLSAHDLYTMRLDQAAAAEQNLNTVYQLNQDLYERGIISHFDLIKKRIELTNLELIVNQYKLDQFMTIVNLYQDLAVGYNYDPKEDDAECS